MSKIYLLRHGFYDNPLNIIPGRLPVQLSEQGRQQAESWKKYFADKQLAHVYSSAVLRCKQTAEIVADSKLPVELDQRLLETLSAYQGYWEGNQPNGNDHFYAHIDEVGGETLAETQQRFIAFWDEVIAPQSQNALICSHCDPLLSLYYYLRQLPLPTMDTPDDQLADYLEKGECWEVSVENGKVVGEILKVHP